MENSDSDFDDDMASKRISGKRSLSRAASSDPPPKRPATKGVAQSRDDDSDDEWEVRVSKRDYSHYIITGTSFEGEDIKDVVGAIRKFPGFLFIRANSSSQSCANGALKGYVQFDADTPKEELMHKFPEILWEEPYFMQTLPSLIKKAAGYGACSWNQFGQPVGLRPDQLANVIRKEIDPDKKA